MNALQLFRQGYTTIAIAKHNGITEAEAYNELSRLREEEHRAAQNDVDRFRVKLSWEAKKPAPEPIRKRIGLISYVGKEERA